MRIGENDYVLGMWVIPSQDNTKDFMLTAVKRDDTWVVEYRFRYYMDKKVFGSSDRKSVYSFQVEGSAPESKVITLIDKLTGEVNKEFKGGISVTMIRSSDQDVVLAGIKKCQGVHCLAVPMSDPEKKLGVFYEQKMEDKLGLSRG